MRVRNLFGEVVKIKKGAEVVRKLGLDIAVELTNADRIKVRSEIPITATRKALVGHVVSIDIDKAWTRALYYITTHRICFKGGRLVPEELCSSARTGVRASEYVVSALEKILKDRDRGYAVVGCDGPGCTSQFMLFHAQDDVETEPELRYFENLTAAVLYCKQRRNCFVIKRRDIAKYSTLTNIGYLNRIRPDLFWAVVQVANSVLLDAIENTKEEVYSVHVDSIKAGERIDMAWPHKVEFAEDEVLHLWSSVYTARERGGYWLVGMIDASERTWWFKRPWLLDDEQLVGIYSNFNDHVVYPKAYEFLRERRRCLNLWCFKFVDYMNKQGIDVFKVVDKVNTWRPKTSPWSKKLK